MSALRLLETFFDLEIEPKELPLFRGAIINSVGTENDMFHNHTADGFIYRYPLIQYRINRGKAAIVCYNDAIEEFQAFFGSNAYAEPLRLGSREVRLSVESVRAREIEMKVTDTMFEYRLLRWLPLNKQNYSDWKQLSTDAGRTAKLESILTGNIISFAKGIGWQIDAPVKVAIMPESVTERPFSFKGTHLQGFGLGFRCNVVLPYGIALGKGAMLDHGIVASPLRRPAESNGQNQD